MSRWWVGIFTAACLLAALYLLTFPLQDYDTFWHLAYGRSMVETGTFINHEIFSYTAVGKPLGSHSQLAQVILYALWAAGGASALLVFKLAVAGIVFWLTVKTAKLFGADTAAGAMLALAVLVLGMSRVVERPEIFSILLQALLIWILFRARILGYPHRWLWSVPPLMVSWDYLHGALYGLIVLCAFVGAETIRQLVLPKFGISRFADEIPRPAIKRMLVWFLATLAVMLMHPNGLLNYAHFWRVGTSGHEYKMYGEWMPPHFAQFFPYWIFLVIALTAIVLCIRHVDMTALAVMLPFLYLSLTYNRSVLAFGLAAVPATTQALARLWTCLPGKLVRQSLAIVLAGTILGGTLAYKQFSVIESHRFGTGVSDMVFPVGSARFVEDNKLSGNMYNMDAFGGYLAFVLSPERKIFNYNQPGVFTALFDYLHKPETRAQWQINYAFVGHPAEIGTFHGDGFVPVYREPCGMVFAKKNGMNAEVIKKHQIQYFNPLLPNSDLLALGRNPRSTQRVIQEMANYLTYRQDPRMADLFVQLLRESSQVSDDRQKAEWVAATMRYNANSLQLRTVSGEIFYRLGDAERAEELFGGVVEHDPADFRARIGLGYVLYDSGRFTEAAEHFGMLAKNYPESADAHYALGLTAFRLCQRQQAREEFEKFLELAPDSPFVDKAKAFLTKIDQPCRS